MTAPTAPKIRRRICRDRHDVASCVAQVEKAARCWRKWKSAMAELQLAAEQSSDSIPPKPISPPWPLRSRRRGHPMHAEEPPPTPRSSGSPSRRSMHVAAAAGGGRRRPLAAGRGVVALADGRRRRSARGPPITGMIWFRPDHQHHLDRLRRASPRSIVRHPRRRRPPPHDQHGHAYRHGSFRRLRLQPVALLGHLRQRLAALPDLYSWKRPACRAGSARPLARSLGPRFRRQCDPPTAQPRPQPRCAFAAIRTAFANRRAGRWCRLRCRSGYAWRIASLSPEWFRWRKFAKAIGSSSGQGIESPSTASSRRVNRASTNP